MPAAIIGDRASGKTTFLGLLYNAMVTFSTKLEGKDFFRYYADPNTVRSMGGLYTTLKSKNWPDATLKRQIQKINFLFGYLKTTSTFIPERYRGKIFKNPFATIGFTVYDVAGEDIQEMVSSADGSRIGESLSETARLLLDSRVLVILVDCSKITRDPESKEFKMLLEYDTTMASLVSLIAFHNSKKSDPKERKIYPVIVFTKFDRIDKSVLEKMRLEPRYPPYMGSSGIYYTQDEKRRLYGKTILSTYYQQLAALLKGGLIKGVSFDEAVYFFSEVHTEVHPETGKEVPSLKETEKGAFEVNYSYPEYAGFIRYFRRIVDEMPDEIREEQEFTKPES